MSDDEYKKKVLEMLKEIKDEIFKPNYDTHRIWRKD